MGNSINFCGIVALSEESQHLSVAQLNKNINIKHYEEPTILTNPVFHNALLYYHENTNIDEDASFQYQIIYNKETEIDGIERIGTLSLKKTNEILESPDTNKEMYESEVGRVLFSKKESLR